MTDKLEQRLRDLSHEELVRVLLTLARSDGAVATMIRMETAAPRERIAAIKRSISAVGRLGSGRVRVTARKAVEIIREVLQRIIDIDAQDTAAAYDLLCRLMAAESTVHDHVDDSNGIITDVFRDEVIPALVAHTQRFTEQKTLRKSLAQLLERDDVGSVAIALREITPYLPDAVADGLLQDLAQRSASLATTQPPANDGWRWDPYKHMIKAIHAGRGDIDGYLRAVGDGGLHVLDHVTLARLHIEHDDYKGAERYVLQISTMAFLTDDEARSVRHLFITHSTNTDAVERLCRAEILSRVTPENVAAYRQRFGDVATDALLQECVAQQTGYVAAGRCDPVACTILVNAGYADAIADALEQTPMTYFGYVPGWYELMDALHTHDRSRAAVKSCRRSLEYIVERADPSLYVDAAMIYHRLPVYSDNVQDWGPIPQHDHYITDFTERHQRKYRLWEIIRQQQLP